MIPLNLISKTGKADYAVTEILSQGADSSSLIMDIRGEKHMVTVNLPAMYNIYNAIGAVAAVSEMGLGAQAAISALSDFKCGFGRMERFELGRGGTRMMLVKNPAGCNQVIEVSGKCPGEISAGGLPQ